MRKTVGPARCMYELAEKADLYKRTKQARLMLHSRTPSMTLSHPSDTGAEAVAALQQFYLQHPMLSVKATSGP